MLQPALVEADYTKTIHNGIKRQILPKFGAA
jgi:hypothetical protein